MENNCKMIQDLLPTYIENLTSDETKQIIENHLNSCKECKNIYDLMKENIEKEKIEDTESIKKIKKYKKRINLIKGIFRLILITILLIPVLYFSFRFYILKMTFTRNTNYGNFECFTIEKYDESIEKDANHYITYYRKNEMKKYFGQTLLEYSDGKNHYYFNNENMTYWVEKENLNNTLNIDIKFLNGAEQIVTNGKINNFELLKYTFNLNFNIYFSDFRGKPYYLLSCNGDEIFVDRNTFYAERLRDKSETDQWTEYRVTTANVNWRQTQAPDFSQYTLIEK